MSKTKQLAQWAATEQRLFDRRKLGHDTEADQAKNDRRYTGIRRNHKRTTFCV
jgi:hypothetical protein